MNLILNSKSKILYDDNVGWVSIQEILNQTSDKYKENPYIISTDVDPFLGFVDWLNAIRFNIPLHQWMRKGDYSPDTLNGFNHVAYTSGTTGMPQKVVNNLSSFINAAIDFNNIIWNVDGAMMGAIPSSTNNAASLCWLPALISNRNLVLKKFNPLSWKTDVEKNGVSIAPGPSIFIRMLRKNKDIQSTFNWSSLKILCAGANFVDIGTREWCNERDIDFFHIYGSTEVPAIALCGTEDRLLNIKCPNTQVRVNEKNILEFKRKDQDEWWNSNDLVDSDTSNGYKLLGRVTTQIKYKDVSISPEQYESIALSIQDVKNAGLTEINNKLILFYEGMPGLEKKIELLIADWVNYFTVPRVIHVDTIPVNNLGKVERSKLKLLKGNK